MLEKCFCASCKSKEYILKKVPFKQSVNATEYEFNITIAVCEKCGAEIELPGILELNSNEVSKQFKEYIYI